MDRKKREQVIQTPAGTELNRLVETIVKGRPCCQCGPIGGFDPDSGTCCRCGKPPCGDYCTSARAAEHLLGMAREWSYRRKMAFCEALGVVLSARLATGHIEARQWLLLAIPEDVARAAVLACMEGT